jgi:hypothetical protein
MPAGTVRLSRTFLPARRSTTIRIIVNRRKPVRHDAPHTPGPDIGRASGMFSRGVTCVTPLEEKVFGGDLLSHTVPRAVPSALKGLASGFGMEPGVSPSL